MKAPASITALPVLRRLRERRLTQARAELAATAQALAAATADAAHAHREALCCIALRDTQAHRPVQLPGAAPGVHAWRDAQPWQRVLQARVDGAMLALQAARAQRACLADEAQARRTAVARAQAALDALDELQQRADGARRRAAEARAEDRLDDIACARWQARLPRLEPNP